MSKHIGGINNINPQLKAKRNIFDKGRKLNVAGLAILLLAISACASVPIKDYKTKPINTGKLEVADKQVVTHEWPQADWWLSYQDPVLSALIYDALSDAPSVDMARLRIQQAQFYAYGVDAAFGIRATADAALSAQKQTYNGAFPKAFAPHGIKDFEQLTIGAKKDLDIWGQKSAELQGAISQIDAANAAKAMVNLNISTSIAAEYAKLQNLYTQKQYLNLLRDNNSQIYELLVLRFKNGLETKARYEQARTQVENLDLQIANLDEKIELQKSAIAAIIGKGPQRAKSIGVPSLSPIFGNSIPSALNTELMAHRPDLLSAKYRAEAAAQKVFVATTKYYPNLSFSGNIGLSSMGLGKLLDSGSLIAQFGPAVSLPVFAKEALDANLGLARTDYEMAVADYNQAILNAFSEIDQAAIPFGALESEIKEALQQEAAQKAAYDNIVLRFKGGVGTKLEVLNAQTALINTKLNVANLSDRKIPLEIALIKALGGGYVKE